MEMSVLRLVNKSAAAVFGIALALCGSAMGADTVQVNLKPILDARSVSTYSNGKVYPWVKGIDGNGTADGYVTTSVATHQNRTDVLSLPDSARFPANANHPTMILNYSNSDSIDFQTHYLSGLDSVTFSVSQGNYSTIYLALTSSEGSSAITVILNYSDGSVSSNITLPDYAQGLTTGFFYVDSNLAKWNSANTVQETAGHNIDGYGVPVNSAKTLTSVKLIKNTAGSYMVLWGATAVGTGITDVAQPSARIAPVGELSAVRCATSHNAGIRFVNLPANTQLTVFSAAGKAVAHAVSANGGSVTFDRGDVTGGAVPTGVYFCELRSGNAVRIMRLIDAK
jgi:hypothetical protein